MGLLAGCQARTPQTPVPAPEFTLKDLSGKPVSLASLKGQIVLLDFWATWCGPCRVSIPLVQQFYETHKSEGLVVLGLNIDEDPSNVYPFVKQFKMSYPVLYAGGSPVLDLYRVEGIPLFVLLDPEGRMVQRYTGFHPKMAEEWEREFQRLKPTIKK